MALVTREDLLAPAVTNPQRKVYELVLERVRDAASPMPPAPQRRLVEAELTLFAQQLHADLTAGPDHCSEVSATTAGDRAVAYPAPDPSEIERCYPLLAHAGSDPASTAPYRVPTGESHACFVFDIPWQDEAQALSIRSRQSKVVHHWTLTDKVDGGGFLDTECAGARKIYAVSALNQQEMLNMPPGVGLQLPARGGAVGLTLAVHYFNQGAATEDASGAEICVARTPRPQLANIVELGVNFFILPPHRDTSVPTTCKPRSASEIHVVRSFPHMHARGVRLDTVIHRADGTQEPLIDVPFSFDNQIAYDLDETIRPGDTLLTTCHYTNSTNRTILAGNSTSDEMCVNFVTVWPAGALTTNLDLAGAEACMEE